MQEAPPDPEEGTREASSNREGETAEAPSDPEEETWEAHSDSEEGTREAPSDSEETRVAPPDPAQETREAPSDPEEETQEARSDPNKETQEASSDSEEKKGVARLAAGSRDLGELVVPARRKLTISDNLPPNNTIAHVESTGARRRGRGSAAKYFADDRRSRRGEHVDMRRQGLDDFVEEGGATGADSEGHVTRAVNRQQMMYALEMEAWRKFGERKNARWLDRMKSSWLGSG